MSSESKLAMAHAKLGWTLIKAQDSKRAEKELRLALELDPKCLPALINLGGILLSRWDFEGCVKINQLAVECAPDRLEAHYNLGLGYLYLGNAEEMVRCFRRVVALDCLHPGGHYHLAVGLLARGEEAEAQSELIHAMNLGYKPEPELLKALEKKQGGNSQVLEFQPNPTRQTHQV